MLRARGPPRYRGAMASRLVSESTTIGAPPSHVFAILADPRQHPRIDGSGSVRDTIRGPERLAKGAVFGVSMKLFGLPYQVSHRVVEFEEDRLIAWRHWAGHRWRYELQPVGEGCRVTESFDYRPYGALRSAFITALGFPDRNRRGITATLARLKTVAEAAAAAAG